MIVSFLSFFFLFSFFFSVLFSLVAFWLGWIAIGIALDVWDVLLLKWECGMLVVMLNRCSNV